MTKAIEILQNPSIYGHVLVQPILWYGRSVSLLVRPLPPHSSLLYEGMARLVSGVVLAALAIPMSLTLPFALMGWGIKYFQGLPVAVSPSEFSTPRATSPVPAEIVCPPELVARAKNKAEELKTIYNELLRESDFEKLSQEVHSFLETYGQYRDPDPSTVDEMTKTFTCVDEMARNLSGIQKVLRYFANYKLAATPDGVIRCPADGNCWVHTSLLGLEHCNRIPEGKTHEALRLEVVQWMRDNIQDATLTRFIGDAIHTHQDVERRKLEEEMESLRIAINTGLMEDVAAEPLLQQNRSLFEGLDHFSVLDYFNHMEQLGSHGGHAEFYAISRMFGVHVAIWRQIQDDLTRDYDEQIIYEGAEMTINALMTREGNHFNYRLPLP